MLVRKRCDTRSESWPGGITLTLVLVLRLKRFDGSSKPMRSYVIRSAERHMTLHCEPREGEGAAVESNPFVQSHSVPNRFALGLNRGFHNKSFSTPTRYRNFSTRCSGCSRTTSSAEFISHGDKHATGDRCHNFLNGLV